MPRALALALLCALAPSADAKCAMWGLAPSVITPAKDALYATGFVVAAINAQDGKLDRGDAADQPAWRVRYGTNIVEPKRETLAPGLVLYKLDGGPVAELLDDKQRVIGKITVTKDKRARAFDGPKIKRITHERRQGRRPSADVIAELDGAVPAGVIAVVVVDAKGKALSWGRVEPGKTSVSLHEERRCQALPNGTIAPKPGDRVTAFWVSEGGEKSSPSKPVAIVSRGNTPVDDD